MELSRRLQPPWSVETDACFVVRDANGQALQAQETSTAKLKEEAQKVVKIISSDKSKTQTYCDLVKVSNQIEQAEPNIKADQLYQQMDELAAKLGPEYIELIGELQEMDPDSKDGKEIGSTLEALDKLCAK
jgi:5'-3' exonuclease